mmetsp:Transcript_37882/g.100896  ORF Transcript_37882/g.100896 Transcript_37882/m.100896 type:complete len:85 (-) Transcript_37882:65-319(-)
MRSALLTASICRLGLALRQKSIASVQLVHLLHRIIGNRVNEQDLGGAGACEHFAALVNSQSQCVESSFVDLLLCLLESGTTSLN